MKRYDDPKYPDVHVKLSDEDGNSMMIVGRVRAALRKHGVSQEELDLFANEALSADYDHVLQTVMKWVETS
jgi:hypothetical protein